MAQHAALDEDRREIVEREDCVNPWQRQRVMRADPADRGVRMRAAHERRVPHPGARDVVDEAPLADEQGAVLEARNARSNQSPHVSTAHAFRSAGLCERFVPSLFFNDTATCEICPYVIVASIRSHFTMPRWCSVSGLFGRNRLFVTGAALMFIWS